MNFSRKHTLILVRYITHKIRIFGRIGIQKLVKKPQCILGIVSLIIREGLENVLLQDADAIIYAFTYNSVHN